VLRLFPLVCLLLTGCLSVSWQRSRGFEEVIHADLQRMRAESADLHGVMLAFGAPLEVNSLEGTGMILTYGWFDERDLGLRVSVPVTDQYSASFNYDDLKRRQRGALLFFDEDRRLTGWRLGWLSELEGIVVPSPAAVRLAPAERLEELRQGADEGRGATADPPR
jgi:hypothetical protein